MKSLENDLRDELARRVASTPPLPHLADAMLRRGRAARRRRRVMAAAAGAVIVVGGLNATSSMPSLPDRRADVAAMPLAGPPRVPLFVGQGPTEVLDWPQGAQRSRAVEDSVQPIAQVPAGLLVLIGGTQPVLGLLGPDAAEPRAVTTDLYGHGVAVSDDGQRAAVVRNAGSRRNLQEIALPSGRVIRSVALAQPTFGEGEPVHPVAYSGDAILLNVGEGEQQRAWLWEGNDEHVVAKLDGVRAALGGADADFSNDRNAIGGRAAFRVADQRCGTEIRELRNGDGNPWALCRETFVSFSPDGRAVLATDATGTALVVHDAEGGDVERTFPAPRGVRASGWESDDTVLYSSVDGPRTIVVRCSVDRGTCATAVEFPYTDRIPQPVGL